MVQENCIYFTKNQHCFQSMKANPGTKVKLDVIEAYVRSWIHKIINYKFIKYSKLVFVDAMCGAGQYYDEQTKEYIRGTSLRVYDAFCEASRQYAEVEFFIYLNDSDNQACDCQRCLLSNNKSNVKILVYNQDVSDFIITLSKKLMYEKDIHTIFFYDPFNVDFHWDLIKLIGRTLSDKGFKKFDMLITHFHKNDPNRCIHQTNLSKEVKKRYELSYAKPFDEIRSEVLSLKQQDRSYWYRDRMVHLLSYCLNVPNLNVAYAPIFNAKLSTVYDIVMYSSSYKAKDLFKKTMYKFVNENYTYKENNNQLSLFDRKPRREIDLFYDDYYHAQYIAKTFSGQNDVSFDFIANIVDANPYIPLRRQDLINNLVKHFGIIQTKEKKFSERKFSFPEYKYL